MYIIYIVDIYTILSNFVFFLPSIRAFHLKRYVRSIIYFIMAWASALYHMCIAFDVCLFDFQFHHYLDFFFAQFIIVMAASYLIAFESHYEFLEYWLFLVGGIAIVVLQQLFPANLIIQAGIVAFMFVLVVGYWLIYGCLGRLPKYRWSMFTTGLALTAGSITLFIFQDSWYQEYWLIHSIWHIAAALGQDFLLRMRLPAPRYVTAASRVI